MNILSITNKAISKINGYLSRKELIDKFGEEYVYEYDRQVCDKVQLYKNKMEYTYIKNAIMILKQALRDHENKQRYISKTELINVKNNISLLEKELHNKKIAKYILSQEIISLYKEFFINV